MGLQECQLSGERNKFKRLAGQVSIYNSVPNEEIPKISPELSGRLLKKIQEEEEGDSISDYVSPGLSTDFWISGQTRYVHCNEKNCN